MYLIQRLELARSIYNRRLQHGLSLRQLADLSRVPKSSLSRYERAEATPDNRRMKRIARVLHMDVVDTAAGAFLVFEE